MDLPQRKVREEETPFLTPPGASHTSITSSQTSELAADRCPLPLEGANTRSVNPLSEVKTWIYRRGKFERGGDPPLLLPPKGIPPLSRQHRRLTN